ncbi:MAG: hypothetical protein R3C26_24920 [Calditrichia bacterium]
MGFEQLRRDNYLGKMNDDFNDIVVFFDADSLDLTDVPPVETPPDCDNDGIRIIGMNFRVIRDVLILLSAIIKPWLLKMIGNHG